MAEKIRLPEGRFLLDDAGVVLDVHRARHAVHERGDVGRAADLVEIAGPPQLLLEGDEIDRVVALGQLHHLVEDAAVRVAVEIVRIDHLGREVEGLVVQQDRPEHGPLRLQVVGKRSFGNSDVGHKKVELEV